MKGESLISTEKSEAKSANNFIDLHIHTTASDGTCTPREVVQIASEMGLKAIAITDHDTVSGVANAIEAAKNLKIEIISGIEFSTEIDDESIHILGLYVDYRNKELITLSSEITDSREIRAKKIIQKLNVLIDGLKIDFADVRNVASGLIGRAHIAQVLIDKGIVQTINEAFELYLKRGAPAYIPRFKLTPIEAVSFLNKIGAIPILAHPCHISEKIELEVLIQELIKVGLAGLEIYYPAHSQEDISKLQALAEKYDLVESGGSDFHGEITNGTLIGCVEIPYSILAKIKKRFSKI
ncbi:MAG: PHP domain-containing protein [Asgard group archaeon]|nr:PHP domain-containing protein [Asgard group archaeon]